MLPFGPLHPRNRPALVGHASAWALSIFKALLAVILWASLPMAASLCVFAVIWCRSQPWWIAAIAAAGTFAVLAAVDAAAGYLVLQLLTGSIVLLCTTVACLAWRDAGWFTAITGVPTALAGAACLLSLWATYRGARIAVVWLAQAACLAAFVQCPMAFALCHATFLRQKWIVVGLMLVASALGAHRMPVGRLAAALLRSDAADGILTAASLSDIAISRLLRAVLPVGLTALAMVLANGVPSVIPELLKWLAEKVQAEQA